MAKKKKEVELNVCPNCGEKPKVVEVQMPSMWKKDSFFIAYKVECECGKHTILSGSENMVKNYWNDGNIFPKT